MSKLIEQDTNQGQYDLPCQEMIVELTDGRRMYLLEGFGGMSDLEGGQYRWRHGIAIQILPTDTLESLRADTGEYNTTSYDRLVHGYDEQRPVQEWPGTIIDSIASAAV